LINTGQGSDRYTFLTGRFDLDVESWQTITTYDGRQSWTAFGRPAARRSSLDVPQLPNATMFGDAATAATHYYHFRRMLIQGQRDNSVEGCRVSCSVNSPFCFTLPLAGQDTAGLVALRDRVNARPTSIEAADLMAMFNLASDPCERGETSFSEGVITNKAGGGSSCTLSSAVPALNVAIDLDIPLLLEGSYKNESNAFSATFDDVKTRPVLRFRSLDDTPDHVKNAELLNSDWGGEIKHVFSEQNFVGFSVGADSCIRAPLN
jgi:hypothetical protein